MSENQLPPPDVSTLRADLPAPNKGADNKLPNILPEGADWWSSTTAETSTEDDDRTTVTGGAIVDLTSKPENEINEVTQNVERAIKAGEGWKLHLNFDYENPDHVASVREYLASKLESKDIVDFKIGEGGGVESDGVGKESTVYVGSLRDSLRIAEDIDSALKGILLPAAGEVLEHDLPLSNNVWGRFSVYKSQQIPAGDLQRFEQWGPDGVPRMRVHDMLTETPANEQIVADSATKLRAMYGDFFDGNGDFSRIFEAKNQALVSLVEGVLSDKYPHDPTAEIDRQNLARGRLGNFIRNITERTLTNEALVGILGILDSETLNGYSLPEQKSNPGLGDTEHRLMQFIGVYLDSPRLAKEIVRQSVVGFHMTGSGALPGILKFGGLMPASELIDKGHPMPTGERAFTVVGGQSTISFVDWKEPITAAKYANNYGIEQTEASLVERLQDYNLVMENTSLEPDSRLRLNAAKVAEDLNRVLEVIRTAPDSLEAKLILANFPIAIGLSDRQIPSFETAKKATEVGKQLAIITRKRRALEGEFETIGGKIDVQSLPIMLTDAEHVDSLRQILKEHGLHDVFVAELEPIITDFQK